MLVEHFLRVGYYDTAVSLAKHFDIEDLTNINLFLVAKDVEEALSQKGECYLFSQIYHEPYSYHHFPEKILESSIKKFQNAILERILQFLKNKPQN